MRRLLTTTALVAGALWFGVPVTAHAAIITVAGVFTSDHCTGGCLTGQANGGLLTITGSDTAVVGTGQLDFHIHLINGNQFINSGFEASFGFNLAGNPLITYSGISPAANYTIPDANGATPPNPPQQAAGSLHMDGTGFFDYGLDGIGSGGSDPLGSDLSFTVTALGLDLTDLESNGSQFFAADIISGTTGKTGGIDITPVLVPQQQCTACAADVPEPASLVLLGAGLFGLGFVRRQRA